MLIPNCSLKHNTGELVAENVSVDMRYRDRSTRQPDLASLWYGTLTPATKLSVSRHDLFALLIPSSPGGVIQIQRVTDKTDVSTQTIQFNGIGDRPKLHNPPVQELPTRICDECGSNFFPPASIMDGLCPECEHHIYGYENCDHNIVGVSCEKCGWDGSVSDYVKSLR